MGIEPYSDELKVDVYSHEILGLAGPVSCASLVTSGLSAYGQHELIFTVQLSPRLTFNEFSIGMVRLLRGIFLSAKAGSILCLGDFITFDEEDLFGRQGVLYADALELDGVRANSFCLAALFLTGGELDIVDRCGYLRILSLLGRAYKYFPYPPWSDTERPELTAVKLFPESILSKMSILKIPGTTCLRNGKEVTLYLPRNASTAFQNAIPQLSELPFAIPTYLDKAADSCHVWDTVLKAPRDIRPSGSESLATSGCFVSIGHSSEYNFGTILEDGYAFELSEESWQELTKALLSTRGYAVRAKDRANSLDLVVAWRDEGA